MKPIMERSFIEGKVSSMQKKKYNKFQWWRRYEYRNTLNEKCSLHDRIYHGDLDASDYIYQAEMELYNLKDKEDLARTADDVHEARKLYHERHRRLQEDFQKDELQLLNEIKRSFSKQFGIKRKDIELFMESFDGTLMDMYSHFSQNQQDKVKASIKN